MVLACLQCVGVVPRALVNKEEVLSFVQKKWTACRMSSLSGCAPMLRRWRLNEKQIKEPKEEGHTKYDHFF